MTKPELLLFGVATPAIVEQLATQFVVHRAADPAGDEVAAIADKIQAIAIIGGFATIDAALMSRLPKLKIVSAFGVGYDHVDAKWAGAHGITVTNTPDVLTEEVADGAIGLLINTLRELSKAERFLRAGHWRNGAYPPSQTTLRNRKIGMVGMGRIGRAIAKRLDAFGVPVTYHARHQQSGLPYRYYAKLVDLARDNDVLIVITPGGPATRNLIDAQVLDALGPDGVLINLARGSVVDEPALIKALRERRIYSAGLDVYADEPNVPEELIAMDRLVLLPHVASGTVYTRGLMDQLVVDNLLAFATGRPPLTPVAETPWRGA